MMKRIILLWVCRKVNGNCCRKMKTLSKLRGSPSKIKTRVKKWQEQESKKAKEQDCENYTQGLSKNIKNLSKVRDYLRN